MSICKDSWSTIAQYLTVPEQVRYLSYISKDTKEIVDDIKDTIHKNNPGHVDKKVINNVNDLMRMFTSEELSESFKKYMICLMAQWVPILNTIVPNHFSNFEQQKITIAICEHNLLFAVNNSRNLHKFMWPHLHSCLRNKRMALENYDKSNPGGKVSSRNGSKSIVSSLEKYPY